jgi:hypothetical protein
MSASTEYALITFTLGIQGITSIGPLPDPIQLPLAIFQSWSISPEIVVACCYLLLSVLSVDACFASG